ncbi:MAG TPA: dockerin type I domain-containing protein, partial [Clostridia bacterium]
MLIKSKMNRLDSSKLTKLVVVLSAIILAQLVLTSSFSAAAQANYGDLNDDGKVNSADASILKRVILGTYTGTYDEINADVNNDKKINSADYAVLKKYLLGTITSLPFNPAASVTSIKSGVTWYDNNGKPVNAHGGGIWCENGKYYLYGEYCSAGSELFTSVAMYSSTDLMNWTFEREILTVQAGGELGPNRIGQRPHIIKCPSTGEYV